MRPARQLPIGNRKEIEMVNGISTGVKIYVREDEYGEVTDVICYNLLQFVDWINRARERNARIIPNGMTSVIVITENRYMVAVADA